MEIAFTLFGELAWSITAGGKLIHLPP